MSDYSFSLLQQALSPVWLALTLAVVFTVAGLFTLNEMGLWPAWNGRRAQLYDRLILVAYLLLLPAGILYLGTVLLLFGLGHG